MLGNAPLTRPQRRNFLFFSCLFCRNRCGIRFNLLDEGIPGKCFRINNLSIDEAFLTGESVAAVKRLAVLERDVPVSDRRNMAYAGSTVPAGYLVCNGSAVSRTTYADLFAAIGTMYGSGDGSTTFNLPDYRGMFLRGHHFGKSSGTTDPDYATRQMGAAQSDLIKSHQHLLPYSNGATAPSGTHATPPWQGIDSTQHSTVAFGGTETRPVNVSVAYIIKH